MKKIRVVCNPKSNPLAFPAMVKYFYAPDGMGPVKYQAAIKERAEKAGILVYEMQVVGSDAIPNLPGAEGTIL